MEKNYLRGHALVDFKRFSDIRELLRFYVAEYQDRPAYIFKAGADRHDVVKSYRDFMREINALGEALLERGEIQIGRIVEETGTVDGRNPYRILNGDQLYRGIEAIAVMGDNSYPWVVSYASVLFGLGVAVPLDRDLQPDEALGLARRAEITTLFFAEGKRKTAEYIAAECPSLRTLIALDESEERQLHVGTGEAARKIDVLSYQKLVARGEELLRAGQQNFQNLPLDKDDLAVIFFTSGTTAMAKGVMVSHFNMASTIWGGQCVIDMPRARRTLSVLPLHHTFENVVGQMALWQRGMTICFNDKLRYLSKNLVDWQIDVIFMVPLILESIYRKLQAGLEKQGKTKIFNFLLGLSRFLRKIGIDLRQPLFKKVRHAISPYLEALFMGGAPLNPEQQRFFLDIGYDVWNAWGLTEASPGVAAGNALSSSIGSVGRIKVNDELWVDQPQSDEHGHEIGEIILRSDSVMIGYYRDPEATAAVLTPDGRLHTGDLGYVEGESVFLSGRAKSMIVLDNGKNIFPEEIENVIRDNIPEIAAIMVWPERNHRGQIELLARLQMDPEQVEAKPQLQSDLGPYLQERILELNHQMPAYKAIKRFFWSTEPMIMTTTRKVKRHEERARILAALEARGLTPLEAESQALELSSASQ